MKKEFHLVVSFDSTSETLMNVLQSVMVEHARKTYVAALLAHGAVNDGSTKPDIHLYSDDFLMGKEDITVPWLADGEICTQMQEEVHEAGGPKSVGGASFGDEEES